MFEHFLTAQAGMYEAALAELSAGRKKSHWMWFIFPQIAGLGRSSMAERFALSGVTEAEQYLQHPTLGPRLRTVTAAVMRHTDMQSANEIFGFPDDLKFRSSMTLFSRAAPDEPLFRDALAAFYDGQEDAETLRLL